jgi:hypothetical protein
VVTRRQEIFYRSGSKLVQQADSTLSRRGEVAQACLTSPGSTPRLHTRITTSRPTGAGSFLRVAAARTTS